MRLGPAFLQTFSVQIVQSAASLAASVLIARSLGPGGQGAYAFTLATVAIAVTIVSVGQFEGNVLATAGRTAGGRGLLARALTHAGLAVAIVGLTSPLWHPSAVDLSDRSPAWLLTAVVGLESAALLLRGINLGQHHVSAYNAASLVQRVGLLLGVVVLRASRLTFEAVLGCWAVASALSVALSGILIWRRSPAESIRLAFAWRQWLLQLKQGTRAQVVIVATLLLVRCDAWMLAILLGPAAVGQVSVAIGLAEWLWYIPSILGSILFALLAADRSDAALERLARASRSVTALVIPAGMILGLIGRWLVPILFGDAFREAGVVFTLLVPGMAFIAIHLVVDSYYAGRGFPLVSLVGALGALGAKVVGNLALVPAYGVRGAALATSGAYGGLLAFKLVMLRRERGLRIGDLVVPRLSDFRGSVAAAGEWLLSVGRGRR